jgi:hypothetical protein
MTSLALHSLLSCPKITLTFGRSRINAPSCSGRWGHAGIMEVLDNMILGSIEGRAPGDWVNFRSFRLSNCTTKAVTQASGQGNLRLDSQPFLRLRWTKRLGSSESSPQASSKGPIDRRSKEPLWVLHEVDVYYTSADLHRSICTRNLTHKMHQDVFPRVSVGTGFEPVRLILGVKMVVGVQGFLLWKWASSPPFRLKTRIAFHYPDNRKGLRIPKNTPKSLFP